MCEPCKNDTFSIDGKTNECTPKTTCKINQYEEVELPEELIGQNETSISDMQNKCNSYNQSECIKNLECFYDRDTKKCKYRNNQTAIKKYILSNQIKYKDRKCEDLNLDLKKKVENVNENYFYDMNLYSDLNNCQIFTEKDSCNKQGNCTFSDINDICKPIENIESKNINVYTEVSNNPYPYSFYENKIEKDGETSCEYDPNTHLYDQIFNRKYFDDYEYQPFQTTDCSSDKHYIDNHENIFYEPHKVLTGERKCKELSTCEKGTFISEPVYLLGDEISLDDGNYMVENRSCIACKDNQYSDKTNQEKCLPQPTCAGGHKIPNKPNKYIESVSVSESNDTTKLVLKKDIKLETECEECGDYEFAPAGHEFNCTPQITCKPGQYYGKDDTKDKAKDCSKCDDNEYVSSDMLYNNPYPTSCAIQPKCSIGHGVEQDDWNSNRNEKINCEKCYGDLYYQDENNHRKKCKDQTTCKKGELISQKNPVATRLCSTIPVQTNCVTQNCLYMDEEPHREMQAKTHPVCPKSSKFDLFQLKKSLDDKNIDDVFNVFNPPDRSIPTNDMCKSMDLSECDSPNFPTVSSCLP